MTPALVQGTEMVEARAPQLALRSRPSDHGYRLFASRNESGERTYAASPKLSLKRTALEACGQLEEPEEDSLHPLRELIARLALQP